MIVSPLLEKALGHWEVPSDPLAWGSIAMFVAMLFAKRMINSERRAFLVAVCLCASLFSMAYVYVYLRGGPRIIDAAAYFHQAGTLASGHWTWTPPGPVQSFHGRFLLENGSGHFSGIFPPGYPLVLALGFLVHAPMAVGPLLGALIVWLTYRLAIECTQDSVVAKLAALFSVFSGALRYHSADTMSHGLAITLFTATLLGILRARKERRWLALSGLATGLLFATRFGSAIAACLVLVFAAALYGLRNPKDDEVRNFLRGLPLYLAALTPGVALLLIAQKYQTGHFLVSTQSMYYSASDGPPGCFRYGFGQQIGCLFEHGDFVRAELPRGYVGLAVLKTTLRRLWMHLSDANNVSWFWICVPMAFAFASKAMSRFLMLAILAVVLAYAPFYFDGNYPGGGARLYADALPAEHVFFAMGCVAFATKKQWSNARAFGAAGGLSLVAFGIHASADHRQLRDRDGGRPAIDATALANVGAGSLVFVENDAAFLLGFDPLRRIVVARRRHDASDEFLYTMLGQPLSYVLGSEAAIPWKPSPKPFVEAESLWPARSQVAGFAMPLHVAHPCVPSGRVLQVSALQSGAPARVTLKLGVPPGSFRVAPAFGPGTGRVSMRIPEQRLEWVSVRQDPNDCVLPPSQSASESPLETRGAYSSTESAWSIELEVEGQIALDRIILEPTQTPY